MNNYFTLIFVLFGYMSVWFFISLIKKRNDIADVAWGLGFAVLSWVSLFLSHEGTSRGILVTGLVTIWGLRLAWHINERHRGKPEDYRYATWRSEWGRLFYVRSFFQVYVLQGALLFFVAFPVLLINAGGGEGLGVLDAMGVCVWLIGFLFEVLGDAQLARFLKDPLHKGKLMRSGLWSYSRHPNYFGEVTCWWGIWLLALSVPGGWMGIIGPLTITALIFKVSGIPLLEKKMSEHPDFAEYQKQTPMFFPCLSKR